MTTPEQKTILIVEDDDGQRGILEGFLSGRGYATRSARDAESALAVVDEIHPDLVLMDVRMPGMGGLRGLEEMRKRSPPPTVILLTAYADVRDAVEAMRQGAVDYLEKPVDLDELVTVIREVVGGPQTEAPTQLPPLPPDLVVSSDALRRAVSEAHLVAPTDATVLITGESGTGKEKIAELIHSLSPRASRPFVRLNCAAIPGQLVESELFGHRRGAFTGADSERVGRFETAEGGTLLLDEIGELPLDVQPKLLRVLEDGSFERVGESHTRHADARVVAATNRDLEKEIAEGRFREDLFWRLNVFQIHLPPIRERREEIPLLARTFLARARKNAGPRISPAALRLLEAYPWPGNVREIANVMARAAILAAGNVVLPEHLPAALRGEDRSGDALDPTGEPGLGEAGAAGGPGALTVEEAERRAIHRALQETGGNRTRAAQLLGISRRTLLYRLKRYGEG